jgi:hypothetical protein
MMGIEMETAIKMNRSSMIILPTMIRKRFKASRFDLKRGVVLVLLALTLFVPWLCLASAALPDNNSSMGDNYIVVNSNNPIITGILGVVVGALATGFVSLWLLEQRLKRETAIKFLHEHYLPLLGTLQRVIYAWVVWTDLYLFSWDNVPGNDSDKLLMFLRDNFGIEWVENAETLKSDDGKTIYIIEGENSAEIMLDEKEEKSTLKISDGRTYDLTVKEERGKLNICDPIKENADISEEETTQFFSENILELSRILESVIRSGAIILLYRINRKTYGNAVALDYLLKDYQYKISHKSTDIRYSDDDLTVTFNKITKQIENLDIELEKMSMPKLIEEYQRIMKDDAPIIPKS